MIVLCIYTYVSNMINNVCVCAACVAIFCTCVIYERNKSNRVTEFKIVFSGESQVPQLVANPQAA